MKKQRRIITVSVIVVILAAVVVLSGCPMSPEAGWSIVGTWTNAAYDGSTEQPEKLIVASDGTFEIYANSTDPNASDTGTYEIASDWTETDYHYFQFKTVQDGSGETWYNLVSLSRNGNTYMANSDSTDYPTEIDVNDPTYANYARQQ